MAALMALLFINTFGPALRAQEKPAGEVVQTPSAVEISLKKLKAKRAETEGSTALPDSVKKNTLTFLDQAILFQEQTDQIKRNSESFAQTIQSAPKRIKEIETELALPTPPLESEKVIKEDQDLNLESLENKIRQEEAALIEAKASLAKSNDHIVKEENAPEQLRKVINKAKEGLKDVQKKLEAEPPPNEPAPVIESRRISLYTEQTKYQTEISASEQRLAGQSVYMPLLRAERDLAEHQVGIRASLIKAWKEVAQKRRQREAEKAVVGAEAAKFEAYRLPEPIQREFDENVLLAEALDKVTREEAIAAKDLEKKEGQVKELEQEFQLAQDRVKIGLRSEAIGLALREQHRSLPSFSGYRQDSARRQSRMSQLQTAHLNV
ncbi:MAG: hypothetical protein JSU59_02645, partial [Nitrospirota bacterium]